MICGFQAHHRLRDSSVSWVLSFSPVVMAPDYNGSQPFTAGKSV
jgi:hypothetical protein